MNIRTTESGERVREGEQVLIGGNNRYRQVCCVFRRSVTDRFGIVTAEFGSVTDHFGDVTGGRLVPA